MVQEATAERWLMTFIRAGERMIFLAGIRLRRTRFAGEQSTSWFARAAG